MSLYGSFATDPELEKRGVIVIYPDPERKEPEAYRIRLARLTGRSAKYKQVQERLMRPYRHMKGADVPDDVRSKIGLQIFVEAAVLSWETKAYDGCLIHEADAPLLQPDKDGWIKGVEVREPDGTDRIVPPTVENLMRALEASPDFLEYLNDDATKPDLYRVERVEADSKNS